jgi:hypothetical protein
VAACFARLGVQIPYDPRGFIAPKDWAECPEVTLLWQLTAPPVGPPLEIGG